MLWTASSLTGYAIEATDGEIGTVSDLLFDDRGWIMRWLVVETGSWLSGRKVLLPLSALGQPDLARSHFPATLTMQQVRDSPALDTDQPVSRQAEAQLYDFYGWNPYWGSGSLSTDNLMAIPSGMEMLSAEPGLRVPGAADSRATEGDPHLRSMSAVTGYHIEAIDGEIGHVEGFLVDAADWRIRYIIVNTRNWWPGQKILVAPHSVTTIEWPASLVHLNLTSEKIRGGPRYDPTVTVDSAYDKAFLTYYGVKQVAPMKA